MWLCSAAGVDEDGRNGSARWDGRGMVAGNSRKSEICRGEEIRGEERLSDGGRWVKLLEVGFRTGRTGEGGRSMVMRKFGEEEGRRSWRGNGWMARQLPGGLPEGE